MGSYFGKNSIVREITEVINKDRTKVYHKESIINNDDKNSKKNMKWVMISQNGTEKKIFLRSLDDKIKNIKQEEWNVYNKIVEEILESEIYIKIKRSDKRKFSGTICEFYENMSIVIKNSTSTLKWYDYNSYVDDGTIYKTKNSFCFEIQINNLIFEHDDHKIFRNMMKKSPNDLNLEQILHNLLLFKNNYGTNYSCLTVDDCHKIYCFVRIAYLFVNDLPFDINI